MLKNLSSYANCISKHSGNSKRPRLIEFIILCSQTLIVQTWDPLILYLSDDELSNVINNQLILKPRLVDELIGLEFSNNQYNEKINFLNHLMNSPAKVKSFGLIISSMDIVQFIAHLTKLKTKKYHDSGIDGVYLKFISNNKNEFQPELLNFILQHFKNDSHVIKKLYESCTLLPESANIVAIDNLCEDIIYNHIK
jgi:hypothetical protein